VFGRANLPHQNNKACPDQLIMNRDSWNIREKNYYRGNIGVQKSVRINFRTKRYDLLIKFL